MLNFIATSFPRPKRAPWLSLVLRSPCWGIAMVQPLALLESFVPFDSFFDLQSEDCTDDRGKGFCSCTATKKGCKKVIRISASWASNVGSLMEGTMHTVNLFRSGKLLTIESPRCLWSSHHNFYISYPCIAWIILRSDSFLKCSKGICQSMKSVKPSHWLVSRFCQNNFYCFISARVECTESLVGHGSFWEFQPQMTRRFPSISGCFGWDPSCIFFGTL